MDFKRGVGSLTCRLCGASYQMPIHHLHEPVDVFSEWLDDCEAAARQQQQSGGGSGGGGGAVPRYQEDDGDDDLPEASGLGRAKAPAKSTPSKDASKGGSQKATYDDLGGGDSEDDDED